MKGISIVICCFNSASRLPETLKHISLQKTSSDVLWEVIVVNNNSTDNTKELAETLWKRNDVPLEIADESKPGLRYARIKGFESAKYEYIIFCDDDNWLDEYYVENAYKIMRSNERIGVLGGKIESASEKEPPTWFERFQYSYAVGLQGEIDGDISKRLFVWGAGMVVRKEVWTKIRMKKEYASLVIGRKGAVLSSGEDSEICALALILGYKLWYSSQLCLKHYLPEGRLKWSYLKKLMRGFGNAEALLLPLKTIIEVKKEKCFNDYKLSWKSELLSLILLLIRHPKKVLKGFVLNEGSSDVLWLHFHLSKAQQLIELRKIIELKFEEYNNLFEKEIKQV